MEKKSWNEIKTIISEDREINFLAEAITPLHALGIEAFLINAQKKGKSCRGIIMVIPHARTGAAISEDNFHLESYSGVRVIQLDDQDKSISKAIFDFYYKLSLPQMKNKKFYYVTPYKPSFYRIPDICRICENYNLEIVLTDEGLASYVDNPYQLTKYFSSGWSIRQKLSFILNVSIKEQFYYKQLCRKGYIKQFLLIDIDGEKWKANRECADSYFELFSYDFDGNDYIDYENAIVFCPGLTYEAGVISRRRDIELFKEIKEIAGPEFKYIVKPHPREAELNVYDSLDCVVEKRKTVAMEKILAHLDTPPICIIGDASTILINATVIFDIPSISINKLISNKDMAVNNYYDFFNKNCKHVTNIPETRDELIKTIKEITDGKILN